VLLLGQSRIFYAMARDGLLPWFGRLHGRHRTPHRATVLTGLFVSACAGVMPIGLVGKLVSIGTLLAFLLVCVGVPVLRSASPGLDRPFKVPMPWVVGLAGAASCLWVMSGLDLDTWVRLLAWLLVGLVIYFTYGRRHSHLQRERGTRFGPLRVDLLGLGLFLGALGGLAWCLGGLAPLAGGAAQPGAGMLTGARYASGHLLGTVACAALAAHGLRRVVENRNPSG